MSGSKGRRIMKNIFIFLCIILLSTFCYSASVTKTRCSKVAKNWLKLENQNKNYRINKKDVNYDSIIPFKHADKLVGYVVTFKPAGFMIMPLDTKYSPVKFINFGTPYEEVAKHWILDGLREEMSEMKDCALQQAPTVTTEKDLLWDMLDNSSSGDIPEPMTYVGSNAGMYPMLQSTWNQGAPYNDYTPDISGSDTPVGCSATAMSQLMYYWKHPTTGQGSNSYTWTPSGGSPQTLSANFNHTYNWSQMFDSYSGGETAAQKDIIARLCSDVGIALEMNYQIGGSGAHLYTNNAIEAFFKYHSDGKTIYYPSYGSASAWYNELIKYIKRGRPFLFAMYTSSGGGHAVVVDGFREYTGAKQLHINYGWGGSCDNYYTVNNITCGYNFTYMYWQYAVVDLYPHVARTWFKHYGGSQSDYGMDIQQTADGGYITAGYTYSNTFGGSDFGIYKFKNNGNKTWFRHYGGTYNERARSIQQTVDGGYIAAGETYSFTAGGSDFAIYRINSSGSKVWFKHYGGANNDACYSVHQTSDRGYILAGYTDSFTHGGSDIGIYKLNSSGNKVWFKHYGGSGTDYAFSTQQTSDGGYIVAGYTESYTNGGADFAIYKLDSSGNKVWFKHYGGTADDWGESIRQTTDGGYIVAGLTCSYDYGGGDMAIYRLDSNGNKIWFKHYGGTSNEIAYSIQQTIDGGYIATGQSNSFTHGGYDFALYKLNSSGNKVWFKHYGGSQDDRGWSVQQAADAGYIVSGRTKSYTYGNYDFAIYKLDANGNK